MLTETGGPARSDALVVRDRPRPEQGGTDETLLTRRFAGLEHLDALVLAVSGGPDSIALLLMAVRWARRLGGAAPALHVATVDHGLRSEGRHEAEMVAATAATHGLPHAILTWTGPKPSTRLQERARVARYGLLAAHAQTIGATHVLTAHHADDQAETVLLRLGRGSGIGGLAGMRRLSEFGPGLWLARPLLDLAKCDLIAICRAERCHFVEDPSNLDPAFARARLRVAAPALAVLGLDTPGLARLGRRMARAEAALEAETGRVEDVLRPERAAGVFRVDLTRASGVLSEIRLRLLRRAIAHVAVGPTIRLERLEALTENVWRALDAGRAYKATLAGTRLTLDREKVLAVALEAPRRRGMGPAASRRD